MPSAVPVLFSPKEYVNQFPEKGNLITEIAKFLQFYRHLSIFVKKELCLRKFLFHAYHTHPENNALPPLLYLGVM